jgi:hypothetical protein
MMRIALPVTPDWPAFTGYGASTSVSWGQTTIDDDSFVREATYANGSTGTADQPIGPQIVPGLRGVTNPAGNPDYYFLMQGTKLSVMVGARGNPNTAGYLSLALSD